MHPDDQRRQWNGEAIRRAGLSAVICTLPSNVLLLTGGYWPVVGTSVAVASHDGRVAVVVPTDERAELDAGFADVVVPFEPGSVEDLRAVHEAVIEPLREALSKLDVWHGDWGYEHVGQFQPRSYVAMHLYSRTLRRILRGMSPGHDLRPADDLLADLRSRCTPTEVDRVRRACSFAEQAFDTAGRLLRPGATEVAVAAAAHVPLMANGNGRDDGYLAVMAGPRSAAAGGAFARSSSAAMSPGDLALVHCNNQAGGYWTDVTRTFCLGRPNDEQRRMYDAVFAARAAALALIRPGAKAADVDAAARSVLADRGYGPQFTHGLGHGVPFAAIAGGERPRVHHKSPDVLQVGSVFNVEPAIYVAGVQGMRHCDVVAVTKDGVEVLTPWMGDIDALGV